MPPRTALTHFLAIPLFTPLSSNALNASLARFAAEVTAAPSSLTSALETLGLDNTNRASISLPTDALRPPSTLHLTLGVMSLPSSRELENAAAFLRALDLSALVDISVEGSAMIPKGPPRSKNVPPSGIDIGPDVEGTREAETTVDHPFVVTLRSLLPMQVASSTTVLYAVPQDASGRLQPFCEALRAAFVEAGLVQPDDRPLKLHASLVNTLHVRKDRGKGAGGAKLDGAKKWKSERLRIDATDLIERWSDEVWAEVIAEKVVICEMGAKVDADGVLRYREVAQRAMPGTAKIK